MENWTETTIGKFCPFVYGKGLPEKDRSSSGEVPVFGSNGIVGKHSKPLVNEAGIIIGRKGTAGAIHFSPNPFWAIDTTFYVSDFPARDLKFTLYLLKTLGLDKMNSDSAVPGLNRENAHSIKIKVPPLEEQKAIAKILSALDDKIELNRRMNQTLENVAQALFKAWFVDFEPVRANLENRASASASPEIAKLFPSEFENGIPKGWAYIKLGELIDTISITHKFPKEEIVFLNTSDIGDGQVFCHEYSKVKGLPGQAKKSIKKNDILYSEIRPANKRFAYVDFEADDYVVSTKLMVLRSKSYVDSVFIYYFLKSNETVSFLQMLAESRSGTFPQITFEQVKRMEILIPNEKVLNHYTKFLTLVFQETNSNLRQNQKLAEIRDSLLPRLISGKIRVGEALETML